MMMMMGWCWLGRWIWGGVGRRTRSRHGFLHTRPAAAARLFGWVLVPWYVLAWYEGEVLQEEVDLCGLGSMMRRRCTETANNVG